MAIIEFYGANIIAGFILIFILGMVGRHIVARNQSMEMMLLGQEFQTSILMAAMLISQFETGTHNDHSYHLEVMITLVFVLIYHGLYHLIVKNFRNYKIEGAITLIVILMGFSQLVVLLSPVVEFHMVKSFLGDIVTVSKMEAIIVSLSSVALLGLYFQQQKQTNLDTIEIALFNKVTKKRISQNVFSFIVLILMLLSIHMFGSLFTIGAIIIPAFLSGIFKIAHGKYTLLCLINSFSVFGAFLMISYFDRLPTTVLIVFFILIISIVYSMIFQSRS